MTVYLPCLSGVIAVRAVRSPASLRLLWRAGPAGGPPILAAGLVWTIDQNGTLLGLSSATGRVRQQAAVGAQVNHFPTPSVGDGLLLAASARRVIAFRATSSRAATPVTPVTAPTGSAGQSAPTGGGGISPGVIVGSVLAGVVVVGGVGWLLWRRRKAGQGRVQLVEGPPRRALS
jgi:hypothetical protein